MNILETVLISVLVLMPWASSHVGRGKFKTVSTGACPFPISPKM